MRFLPFFLLLLAAAGTAAATSTPFSIAPGDCEVFLVSGSEPTIHLERGDLSVQSVIMLGPGLWRVELCCESASSEPCEGWIES